MWGEGTGCSQEVGADCRAKLEGKGARDSFDVVKKNGKGPSLFWDLWLRACLCGKWNGSLEGWRWRSFWVGGALR